MLIYSNVRCMKKLRMALQPSMSQPDLTQSSYGLNCKYEQYERIRNDNDDNTQWQTESTWLPDCPLKRDCCTMRCARWILMYVDREIYD